jgi:hypothetical protein
MTTFRVAIGIGLVSTTVLASDAVRTPIEKTTLGLLMRFLPQDRNQKLCFASEFRSTLVNLVELGPRDDHPNQNLESLAAQLYWDDAKPLSYDNGDFGYDRRYEVLIEAHVTGWNGPLFGGAEYPFRERDMIDPETGKVTIKRSTAALYCFQDCGGGSLAVEPASDGKGLILSFEPGDWLRVVAGCGERGQVRFDPSTKNRKIRLEPASAKACQTIEDHYR